MSNVDYMNDDRFDGLYLNVANTTRGIDPLLHTLFSFLRRKSDFFTEKGTDVAVEKMNEIMKQHVDIVIKSEQQEAKKKAAAAAKKQAAAAKQEKAAASKKKAEPVVEMTDGAFDISEVDTAPTPVVAVAAAAAAAVEAPVATAKAVLTKEISMVEKKDDKKDDDGDDTKEKPVGNGGAVPERYVWTQTLSEVNVVVTVPENTRGRDLNVTITKNHLKVGLRSQPKNTYIVDAPLTKSVICDDSFWTVEDGSRLAINLQKSNAMEWWDSVCQDDPKIDIRAIQPENSSVSDLDGETRKTVEKMMYDQRQKALGKPSSDEEIKMGMFEKFQKQHPEMDFSNAKIT
jgi:hypothetical protein